MDYPYEVPENWVLISLLEAFDNRTSSNKKLQQKQYAKYGKFAIIDQGQELIGGYTDDESMIFMGNLPVIVFGDHTRCVKYINFPFAQGADGVKVLEPKKFFLPKALFYALQNLDIPNMGYRRHYPLFKNYIIPLPPLPEQHRIVARIEALFSKLDEAKEKTQSVLDGFENRRAAILHKAFTGELTKKWREERGINPDTWLNGRLSDCCSIGSGGTPSRKNPEYYNGDIAWIKTGEINWNEIYYSEEHISQTAIENSSAKLYPAGSVLVAMYGMGNTRGRAAILKISATTNQAVCVLQPKDYLLSLYLFYYFMCNYWNVRSQAVGGNQLNLSGTIISKFQIKIPSLDEQKEIVCILDRLLSQEQQAKQAAENIIAQIDIMKKSILARAFRGELGTNDPNDEPAQKSL